MELTLFVDHQCNLRCSYCYNGDKFTRTMSTDTLRKAIDLSLSKPIAHLDVSFFGGEPLLRLDRVREAVQYAEERVASMNGQRPTLRFIMNTNATIVDDEALELMSPPRSFTAFVSLDGARDNHDRFRIYPSGAGSYDDVLAGIGRLRERKIPFQLVSVINAATARGVGDAVRSMADLGATKLILAPNFRDDWTDGSIAELREGLRDVGAWWKEQFRAGRAVPLEPIHGKILTHLKGGIPCPSRCLIGGVELTVTPSGRVYPCAQMVGEDTGGELVIGTVDRGIEPEKVKHLQTLKDRVESTCEPCAIRDRCQSHCGCRHIALSGELGKITATLCEVEAAFIDAADEVAEELYAEGCTAFVDYYYKKKWVAARGGVLTQLRRSKQD